MALVLSSVAARPAWRPRPGEPEGWERRSRGRRGRPLGRQDPRRERRSAAADKSHARQGGRDGRTRRDRRADRHGARTV